MERNKANPEDIKIQNCFCHTLRHSHKQAIGLARIRPKPKTESILHFLRCGFSHTMNKRCVSCNRSTSTHTHSQCRPMVGNVTECATNKTKKKYDLWQWHTSHWMSPEPRHIIITKQTNKKKQKVRIQMNLRFTDSGQPAWRILPSHK